MKPQKKKLKKQKEGLGNISQDNYEAEFNEFIMRCISH